jgi:signal transduction histidine kinase
LRLGYDFRENYPLTHKLGNIRFENTMKLKVNWKYNIPYIVIVIILAMTGYFARLNHNNFEKTVVNQAQTQLLITALSEAQSIERYSNNINISAAQIDELVKHINDLERVYALIIDNNANIISFPRTDYIGKNVLAIIKEKISTPDGLKLNSILQKTKRGEQGTDLLDFFSDDANPKIVKTLLAFAPIRIGNTRCSIIVAMEYNAIASPVNKNARDSIVFAGFMFLVFFILAFVLYRQQKKRADEQEKLSIKLEKNLIELKATQTQLIQSEKMGIVGKLASSVAHEVKNPLAIIILGIEYLKEKLRAKDEDVSLTLKDIEVAVGKADNVIKGLLDFASVSKLVMKSENLNLIIDNSLQLMKKLFDEHRIHVTKNLGENLSSIEIDKNKIEQVFFNLILNAIEAMPGGGNLTIRTYIEQQENVKWVAAQIEDTGTGIPEAILENIFEPFFTTKRVIGGSGLGLTIVKNIIDMHGGKINISNKKNGHGVSIMVLFKT